MCGMCPVVSPNQCVECVQLLVQTNVWNVPVVSPTRHMSTHWFGLTTGHIPNCVECALLLVQTNVWNVSCC